MPPANTKTVANSVTWAQHFLGRRPFYFSPDLEPALTTANTIIQTMLQPPFKWRWNRKNVAFQTIDPTAVWIANHAYAAGYRLKDSNGNMQTVTTAGTSQTPGPVTWSTTVGGTTTDGTVTWTMSGITDYVQAITDFGFIEKATVTNAAGIVSEISNIDTELSTDAGVGRASSMAPYLDDNAGNVSFRFMPGIPDALYTVNVIYQKKPTLLTGVTGTNGTWPIPDEYGHVYNNGLLFYFLLYAGDARGFAIGQKFASNLIALSEGLDEQQKAIFLGEWDFILEPLRQQLKLQQGATGRAM